MAKINQKLLDKIAKLEVDMLLEGLNDEKLRKNPSFMEKVRKFLKENNLETSPQTKGIQMIKQITEDIPIFEDKHIN